MSAPSAWPEVPGPGRCPGWSVWGVAYEFVELPGVRRRVGHGNPGDPDRDPGEPVPVQRPEAARRPAGALSGVQGHRGEDRRGRRGCRLLRASAAGLQVLAGGIR